MIELRYLLKQFPRPRGIDDCMMQPPLPDFITVPVLQYREWPKGLMPMLDPEPGTHTEPRWQDVPVVSEPAASQPTSAPDQPSQLPDKP